RPPLKRFCPLELRNWLSAHTEATVVASLIVTKLGRLSNWPSAALRDRALLLVLQLLVFGTPPFATIYIWVVETAPQTPGTMLTWPVESVIAVPQEDCNPAPNSVTVELQIGLWPPCSDPLIGPFAAPTEPARPAELPPLQPAAIIAISRQQI